MLKTILLTALFSALSFAADIAGKWSITAKAPHGDGRDMTVVLVLQSVDGKIQGTIGNTDGDVPIENVEFKDPELTFTIRTEQATYQIKATVSGDSMKGTYTAENTSGTFSGSRTADK